MDYYKLSNSGLPSEIGCYPQSSDVKPLGFNTSEVMSTDVNLGEIIPPEPILEDKAKLTTLLSVSSLNSLIFLTLQSDFIEFINKYNTGNFNTYHMKVHFKEEVLEKYLLFHITEPAENKYIDYFKSEFYIGKQKLWEPQNVGERVKIKTYKEYLNIKEVIKEEDKGLRIQCPKIVYDFSLATHDFIRFAELPQAGYCLSERLKNDIEENGFTGFKFQQITNE